MLTGLMLVRLRREGAARRAVWSMLARALVAGLAAGAATWAWVAFTDTVKNANPLARVLTTTALHEFNYGTLAQRLTGGFWRRIADTSLWAVLTPANLAILALFGLILTRGRRAATLGLAACFLAGPLTFANLYFVHDYYFYADGVFLLAALVIAWSQLLDLEAFPLSARLLPGAVAVGGQGARTGANPRPGHRATGCHSRLRPRLERRTGLLLRPSGGHDHRPVDQ